MTILMNRGQSRYRGLLNRLLRRRRQMPLVMALMAAGCAATFLPDYGIETMQNTVQFASSRLDRTWAAPSGGMIALDRNLGSEREQLIGLANDTTLDGDNFIWMRARVPDGYQVGTLMLEDFLSRVGEIPTPFTRLNDQDLRVQNDSLGSYFYVEYRTGTNTNCVLAFRRITSTERLLPNGTNTLEVLLRNCVVGGIEQALLPITDRQMRVSAVATGPSSDGGGRMLSPFAGPLVQ